MKRIFSFVIILLVLAACNVVKTQVLPTPAATNILQAGMPNPASIYCEQNGNKLEIRTAADGSQSGICLFSDGSTCDEWAYFKGECGPAAQESPTPGTTEEVSDWWGVIKSLPAGAQYDDFFERQDLGKITTYGIDSIDPEVSSLIKSLRDSGKIVHLYGLLINNVPDYYGSQIQVDRIEVIE